MNSEEYLKVIEKIMQKQDITFNWFLTILGIFLAVTAFMQWRFSSKQIESIKEDAQNKILIEKTKIINSMNNENKLLNSKIDEIETKLESHQMKLKLSSVHRFQAEITESLMYSEKEFYRFQILLDINIHILEEEIGIFNQYINMLNTWLLERKSFFDTEYSDFYLNRIIKTLEIIEGKHEDKAYSNLDELRKIKKDNVSS